MGAGILPACIHNGKLYFLFGKENIYNKTPGFGDFGGGQEKNETLYQTAIREGSEELMGFIGDIKTITSYIKKGNYCIQCGTYAIYIFHYPYDSKLPVYFNNSINYFEKFLPKNIIKKYTCFEKSEIKWLTINDIKKNKKQFRRFLSQHINTIINNQNEIKQFIENISTNN